MRLVIRLAAILVLTNATHAAPPATTQPSSQPATTRVALTRAQLEVQRRVNQQDPAVPAVKVDRDGNPDATFLRKHAAILERVKRPAEVAFVGDSITELWQSVGRRVFAAEFGDERVANLGVSGDHVQNVLWRIQQGELDGIQPKVVVLLVGTNNIFNWTPADIARGVGAAVEAIRAKQPQAKVLLLGVFPRGELPSNPLRAKVADVNALLAKFDDGGGAHVRYLDLADRFLEPDGTIAKTTFYDFLHPAAGGYQRWADAMKPVLAEMTK